MTMHIGEKKHTDDSQAMHQRSCHTGLLGVDEHLHF